MYILLVLRPNTRYMLEHQDFIGLLDPGYLTGQNLSKTTGFSPSGISRKISDKSTRFYTTTEVPPVCIYFGFRRYRFAVSADINMWFKRIKENFRMAYVFVTGDVKVTAPITVEDSIK